MKTMTISILAAALAALSACGREQAEQVPAAAEEQPEANGAATLNDAVPPPAATPPADAPIEPEPKRKIRIAPEPKLETPKPPPVDPHAGHDINKM